MLNDIYAQCHVSFTSPLVLSVAILNVVMLSVVTPFFTVILNVAMLMAIILSVLSVMVRV